MTTSDLILGDCLEKMKELADESVECCVVDPPYFKIVASEWDNQWKEMEHYITFIRDVALECKRVLKPNGSLYMFGDDKVIAYIQVELDKHLTLLNSLVWYKTNGMGYKTADNLRSWAPVTERILFYTPQLCRTGLETVEKEFVAPRNPFALQIRIAREEKGVSINEVAEYGKFYGSVNHGGAVTNWERGYNIPSAEQWGILCDNLPIQRREYEDLRREYEDLRRVFNADSDTLDVIKCPIVNSADNTEHPTTKPLRLIERLITVSTNVGMTVLDPMMGSGTTGVACVHTNRNFIGIERDSEYFAIAKHRIENTQLPLL